ncbi:MAG: HAD family hydrolase [Natrialbaceae archaeon]|nr:HAD family hydrolase [Natrialbaceae archaeon]
MPGDVVVLDERRRRPGGRAPPRGDRPRGRRGGTDRRERPRREGHRSRSTPTPPLAERTSMVFKGTNVTRGQGRRRRHGDRDGRPRSARSPASSPRTEETDTPLQEELDRLGRTLGLGVLVLAALVVPLLLLRGTDADPGRPDRGLARRRRGPRGTAGRRDADARARRPEDGRRAARSCAGCPAVEALGSVDVICTDKTGTLTRGEMTVQQLWVHDTRRSTDRAPSLPDRRAMELLLRAGALCNDATLEEGDPTEQALVELADRQGHDVDELRAAHTRTDEMPFSSERKWMGTVHDDVGYVKGAPEVVLEHLPIDSDRRRARSSSPTSIADRIARARSTTFADDALRVLAVATREDVTAADDLEAGLVLLGLAGMLDPPREEVADAIAATHRAGIDVKMVTGDNVRTAAAIGRRARPRARGHGGSRDRGDGRRDPPRARRGRRRLRPDLTRPQGPDPAGPPGPGPPSSR